MMATNPTGERHTEVELSIRLFRWKWTLFRYENMIRRTRASNIGSAVQ